MVETEQGGPCSESACISARFARKKEPIGPCGERVVSEAQTHNSVCENFFGGIICMKAKKLLAATMSVMMVFATVVGVAACGSGTEYKDEWTTSRKYHWHESVDDPDVRKDEGEHTFNENEECTVCGYYNEWDHEHKYATTWSYSSEKHYHLATCGHNDENHLVRKDAAPHSFGADGTCETCGYKQGDFKEDATAGWYVVGNGIDSLNGMGWTAFNKKGKLEKISKTEYQITLTIYENDEFKFAYNDGTLTEPDWTDGSGWSLGLEDALQGYFTNSEMNVTPKKGNDGCYTFTITGNPEDGYPAIAVVKNNPVEPKDVTEEMYVVGILTNYSDCNWPDTLGGPAAVQEKCPKMTLVDGMWEIVLELSPYDTFKVYNALANGYYPTGMNNDISITGDPGWYKISIPAKSAPTTQPAVTETTAPADAG